MKGLIGQFKAPLCICHNPRAIRNEDGFSGLCRARWDRDARGRWQSFSARLGLWGAPSSHPKSPPETPRGARCYQPNQSWVSVFFLKKLGQNIFVFFAKRGLASCGPGACARESSAQGSRERGSPAASPSRDELPQRWFAGGVEPGFLEQPERFQPGMHSTRLSQRLGYLRRSH